MARLDVNGKVAVVTGAARGIGFETARALHARGAAVALIDLDRDAAEAAAASIGRERTLGLAADVTDRDAIGAAVERAASALGGLDILVANAGIAPLGATILGMDEDQFERVVEVDLLGVYRTVRAGLPQIAERRGHVVVVASVYAFMNGAGGSPYAIAKAGVEQLGRALRLELSLHGASASVAYFGFIDTVMVHDTLDNDPIAGRMVEQAPRFLRKRLPPSAAGEAIARGIERRAPRIIAPRRWTIFSVLRGILNPLSDAGFERRSDLQSLLREMEERALSRDRSPLAR